MKILRSKNKKKISLGIAAVILLVGIATASAYTLHLGPFSEKTDSASTAKEERDTGTDIKKQSVDQTSKGSQTGSDPAPSPKPIPGSDKSSVGAEITSANQDSTYLHVRVLIQAVISTGNCNLTMTGPHQKSYSDSVQTQALPSSSTCRGFDIPLSQLTQGNWSIKLELSSNTLTATANKMITVY